MKSNNTKETRVNKSEDSVSVSMEVIQKYL